MLINSPGKINFFLIVLSFWIVSIFCSCEEYKEGCMDSNAINYDYQNELPCCCEYPRIQFQTTLKDNEGRKAFTDTFYLEDSTPFLVNEISFIASEVLVENQSGIRMGPTDSLIGYIISPDILPVRVSQVNSTGASFIQNDSFRNTSFQIRNIPGIASFVPEDFPIDHPFRDSVLYNFTEKRWNYLKIRLDFPGEQPLNFEFSGEEINLPVSMQGKWGKIKGKNLTINFLVNANHLMRGITLDLSNETKRSIIMDNMSGVFEPPE